MGIKVIATNRKARHEYHIHDTFEAGLVLMGSEIKSIRAGHVSLQEGYVAFQGGEAWLVDVHIAPYNPASREGHEPRRRRKLLCLQAACRPNSLGIPTQPGELNFGTASRRIPLSLLLQPDWDRP